MGSCTKCTGPSCYSWPVSSAPLSCRSLGTSRKCTYSPLPTQMASAPQHNTCYRPGSHRPSCWTRGTLRSTGGRCRPARCPGWAAWSRCRREACTLRCSQGCRWVSRSRRWSSMREPSWSWKSQWCLHWIRWVSLWCRDVQDLPSALTWSNSSVNTLMTLSYVIVMPNLITRQSVRVNLRVIKVHLRKLLWFFSISDGLVENFSATQWYSQWLECLQEAAWTFICRFTHHVKSLLEADDVCFDVQVWPHLE